MACSYMKSLIFDPLSGGAEKQRGDSSHSHFVILGLANIIFLFITKVCARERGLAIEVPKSHFSLAIWEFLPQVGTSLPLVNIWIIGLCITVIQHLWKGLALIVVFNNNGRVAIKSIWYGLICM